EPYKEKMIYTIAGHTGNGNFHIIPLMDFNDPELPKIINDLSASVYKLVIEYGGSITAEHNDGIIRTPFLKAQFGEKMVKIFEEIKDSFDPQNIFNPHKKVHVETSDIEKYMHAGRHNPVHGS
ncbi:MAG TPA: FAD-linked oxidase C-terminal domain-containing protein, partial [Candidatus Paceibacterota bacterium]|nr:FAD-linked oxidase C-terminal domain-containing protein [Candidatus Paceibacterota bacterium]